MKTVDVYMTNYCLSVLCVSIMFLVLLLFSNKKIKYINCDGFKELMTEIPIGMPYKPY